MRRSLIALTVSLLLVVGIPAAWVLTRPSASDGVPVVGVGQVASPSATAPAPARANGTPRSEPLPTVPVTPAVAATVPAATAGVPVRLRIPAIDVDAAIRAVGVEPDGSMTVPKEAALVGWYRFGPRPGDTEGAAVVTGHVDARDQGPGAMFRLRELGVGDRVTVERSGGAPIAYRVVGKETITKSRLPVERLFARDGDPRLVLITCGGPFQPELGSYRDNVVVVAVPVTS